MESNNIPKIKHFWWKACTNSLATRENIYLRRCSNDLVCQICKAKKEIPEHMLFKCQSTRKVWFGMNIGYRVNKSKFFSVQQWTSTLLEKVKPHSCSIELLGKIATVVRSVWKARNNVMLNLKEPNPLATVCQVEASWNEMYSSLSKEQILRAAIALPQNPGMWFPTNQTKLNINCDGAYNINTKQAAVGILVRNHQGKMVEGRAKTTPLVSNKYSEAKVVSEACVMTNVLKMDGVTIEFDSLEAEISPIEK